MASPQLENGFLRIANEIIDEVLRRDFSKRQLNILHLIWRLSYGCNNKSAKIPRMADFSLCGVNKQNIKKELEHLETCKVISWDKSTNAFTFNKNHKEWIITPIMGWKESELDGLVHLNIKEKFSKQEQKASEKGSQNKNIPKEPDDGSSQNKNIKQNKVLKLSTWKFSKQELPKGLALCRSKRGWVPKDIIKDIKDKDIKDININNDSSKFGVIVNNNNPFTYYEKNFEPFMPPAIRDKIIDWLEDFSDEMLILAMEKSLEQGVDKSKWSYVNRILVNWHKKKLKTPEDVAADDENFHAKQNRRFNQSAKSSEVIPDWFQDRNKPKRPDPVKKELPESHEEEKKRKELADLIAQYASDGS